MFTYTYETRYGDFKDFENLKKGALLDIVQDISTKEADFCGYGVEQLREMNLAWLMQGINVCFEKPAKILKPIVVETAVQGIKGVISERGCILKQDGEVVAKTIANWFTFNTEKMRVCKIPEEIHNCYTLHNFNDIFFTYKKPEILNNVDVAYKIRVSNKDIDTNKHLNNQKGAELLMDALPFEYDFKNLRILYKKSAFLGDELEVCVQKNENGYYVHLQTTDKQVCVVGEFE